MIRWQGMRLTTWLDLYTHTQVHHRTGRPVSSSTPQQSSRTGLSNINHNPYSLHTDGGTISPHFLFVDFRDKTPPEHGGRGPARGRHAAHYPRCRRDLAAAASRNAITRPPNRPCNASTHRSPARPAVLSAPSTGLARPRPAFPGPPPPAISGAVFPSAAWMLFGRLPLAGTPLVTPRRPTGPGLGEHFRQHPGRTLPLDKPSRPSNNGPGPHRGPTSGSAFPAAGRGPKPRKVVSPSPGHRLRARSPEHVREQRRLRTTTPEPWLREGPGAGLRDVHLRGAARPLSPSARSSATCALCAVVASGRPRAASVTTCWGRCTPSATS